MKGQEIVKTAKQEIGNLEIPANSNKTKYGKWFGYDGVAWCGIFCSWVYAHTGLQLPNIGFSLGFAGCQTAVAYFIKNKQITKNPQSGDLVFFDWNGDGRYDHVGIFVGWKIEGKVFITVEGNTSLTNQSNGGQVMLRERKNSGVVFAHPKILDL